MIGFYNVLKPTGVSSSYVVNRVKRLTGEKVGHLGTLDPLASGVLPVAVGKATRFFDYFLNKDKVYYALIKFGVLTDTLDSEGKILKQDVKKISLEQIKKVAKSFIGETLQEPPLYSARSKDGIRGYQAALKNQKIQLDSKKINIYSVNVEKWFQEDVFALTIHCSSGTYVRSLLRDIADQLGTVATTVSIIRLKSGLFKIDNAVTLDDLEKNKSYGFIEIGDVLPFKKITLLQKQAKDLWSGKEVNFDIEDGEYLAYYNQEVFSLVDCNNKKIKNKIYLYDKGEL